MTSAFTANLALEIPARGDYSSTGWDSAMDPDLNIVDQVLGGIYPLSVSGGSTNLVLNSTAGGPATNSTSSYQVYNLTGTLASDHTITFPSGVSGRRIIIPNVTMGGHYIHIFGSPSDTAGVYFQAGFSFPHPIIIINGVAYWDYGGSRPGEVADFPVGVLHNGWLPCDGRVVSQARHAALYSMLATTFGSGTVAAGQPGAGGAGFGMPDYRGTATIAADNFGTQMGIGQGNAARLPGSWSGAAVNVSVGENIHVLSVAELASHGHNASDSGHYHTFSDPGHAHGGGFGTGQYTTGLGAYSWGAANQTQNTSGAGTGIYGAAGGGSVYYGYANISVAANGSSSGHNNVPLAQTTMRCIRW